jgi:hypothetical protein
MQDLVGYRHEETEARAERPARPKIDVTRVTEWRQLQIKTLVYNLLAENDGCDWNDDEIDIETVGVLLDEQHEAEEEWLAENWDAVVEEVRQKIEREHERERGERELSVPLRGR